MFKTMPWLDNSDRPACRAWAQLEVLAAAMFANLIEHGHVTADGNPRRLLDSFKQIRAIQLQYEKALGMVPETRKAFKESTYTYLSPLEQVARWEKKQNETNKKTNNREERIPQLADADTEVS
jgi:hypothetical protein